MTLEIKRIYKLFDDLYDHHPWLGLNILEQLNDVNYKIAYHRVTPKINTIWEIVNHMIS